MPDFSNEDRLMKAEIQTIAGVDEAGRGAWAGPVVCAAVILNRKNVPKGIRDSKKLTAKRRSEIYYELIETTEFAIGISTSKEIDKHNVLQATLCAMARAITNLPIKPDAALIDGNHVPVSKCPCFALIKGDQVSLSIAAASIIAKVTRDKIMETMEIDFPKYGFKQHKGYGTSIHQQALKAFGPCPEHRFSFSPIAQMRLPFEDFQPLYKDNGKNKSN